jgi:hypothetical protein
MITTLVRVIIGLKIAFLIGVIILALVYPTEIGDFFTGALARFDHMISYGDW